MGFHVLYDSEAEVAVLYCNTSDAPFGDFSWRGIDAREEAESFLAYLHTEHNTAAVIEGAAGELHPIFRLESSHVSDPRCYTTSGLARARARWESLALTDRGKLNSYGDELYEWLVGSQREAPPEPSEVPNAAA